MISNLFFLIDPLLRYLFTFVENLLYLQDFVKKLIVYIGKFAIFLTVLRVGYRVLFT